VIIRMTDRQLMAVHKALESWLYGWLVEEGKIDTSGKKVDVLLLPDAWLAISEELIAHYATAGGSRRGTPPLWDAMRKIVKAVNERATHPAFKNTAVAGRQYEVIPAWVPLGERNVRTHWSPWVPSHDNIGHFKNGCNETIGMTIDNFELLYLWPDHTMDGGQMISSWEPAVFGTPTSAWMSPSWDDYERFIKARSEA
jgi:hypothetical protein